MITLGGESMSLRSVLSLLLVLAVLLLTACVGQAEPSEPGTSGEGTSDAVTDETEPDSAESSDAPGSEEPTDSVSSEPQTDPEPQTEEPPKEASEPVTSAPHAHDWDRAETVSRTEPTCTENGSVKLRCSCGEERTDTLEALGHSYTVTSRVEATCDAPGSTVYTCSRCGGTYEENTAALGHHFVTTSSKQPTCEEPGWGEETCDRCGLTQTWDTAALGHQYTETASVPATCETDGSRTLTCSVCGKTRAETIPATGHDFRVTETPATCESAGSKSTVCSRCGKKTEETTPALGHRYQKDAVESTAGLTVEVCSRCGDRKETLSVIPILRAGYQPNWGAYWNNQHVKMDQVVEGRQFDDVLVGKTGLGSVWLYHESTRADTEGTNLYSEAQLNLLKTVMEGRAKWCADRGIAFYFLITPNKDSVYPEYLPDSRQLAGNRRIDQVVNYLRENTTVKVIDVRDALSAAKAARPGESLYYPLDSHWNNNGGYAAYEAVMNVIRKDFPNAVLHARSEYQIQMFDSYFKDNAFYLGLYDRFSTQGPVYTLKTGKFGVCIGVGDGRTLGGQFDNAYVQGYNFSDGTLNATFKCNAVPNAPSVCVINDSSFIALTPFFRDSFSTFSRHWTNRFESATIESEHPDIVIYQCVEVSLNEAFSSGAIN